MKIDAKGYAQWNRAAKWWECECGGILPHGKDLSGDLVRCSKCGKVWEYGYWKLPCMPGVSAITGLQPRLLVPFNAPRGEAE